MNEKSIIEKILSDYDQNKNLYDAFVRKVEHLTNELIANAGYTPHTVTARTKERASLQKKIQKTDSRYNSLEEVTDVAGVRITTFFHDDVDRIADVLSKEFEILPNYSVDKRQALDPDQFGYLSLHYVVRLSPARRMLPEYRRFENLRCEVQIRSILQHAWAEIEHDLGYKTTVEVPKDTRRQFSRLAGLLELADQEFGRIRSDLANYEKNIAQYIKERPTEVLLDKASLNELLRSDVVIKQLDGFIASKLNAVIAGEGKPELLLELLKCVGITSVAQLKSTFLQNEKILERFALLYIGNKKFDTAGGGISVLYLTLLLLAEKGDRSFIIEKANALALGPPEKRESLADEIINAYIKAKRS
jgi:putative GTP pyrophosphokinase